MTYATSLTSPSPVLIATLPSQGPENVNITTLNRCTEILLGPPQGTTTEFKELLFKELTFIFYLGNKASKLKTSDSV